MDLGLQCLDTLLPQAIRFCSAKKEHLMSAVLSPIASPTHAGAERLAGLWNNTVTAWQVSAVVWRRLATRRGAAEMDARMRRDVGLTPKLVRAELNRAPWQIEAGLR